MGKQLTSCSVAVTMAAQFANLLDLSTVNDALRLPVTSAFTDGTGANKAQIVFHDEVTRATGGTDSYDLSGGINHAFGVATFSKVKAILIHNKETVSGRSLQVGGGAACLAAGQVFANTSDIINVPAGGILLLTSPVDGFTVTNSTADTLAIANACGSNITYDIVIIGEGT
jgi:hypothetical protein